LDVNIFDVMIIARKISLTRLIELVTGRREPPPGQVIPADKTQKWDVAVLVPDCGVTECRFTKTLQASADDDKKRSNILVMLFELFRAIQHPDYKKNLLEDSSITVKVAHTFKHGGHMHNVMELKYGNKDRIYFYANTGKKAPEKNVLFLLMAHHKKDNTTPDEVKNPCTKEIKRILDAKGIVDFCKEDFK